MSVGIRNTLNITNEELQQLDLSQFNNGINPYGPHDNSLSNGMKRGLAYYRSVVQQKVQFTGGEKVLDLLCGFGRWTMFLAEQNDHVIGIDQLEGCTTLARNMCAHFGFDNVEFQTGDASLTQSFAANEFDYVWMWSALQYVNRGAVLAEVSRILKPGGRLYVSNYNSTGIMLQHLMKGIDNNTINVGASQWSLSALVHGPDHDGNPNYATVDSCPALCERYGLKLVKAAGEPALDLAHPDGLNPEVKPKIVYNHYFPTIEFVAEKPLPVDDGSGQTTSATFFRRVARTVRMMF